MAAWFGQGKDTIEWEEFRDDVLFFKWPAKEIKRGAHLIIRPGQEAVFLANGAIEGIFSQPGNYDIVSQIVPFLSTLKGVFTLRGDTGMRAEVYFINVKELLIPWGTRQRIMMPSPEVPSGIPIGCNGNLIIKFADYLTFINKVAGVKATFSTSDVSERIMGELNPIIAECMLNGQQSMAVNALISLQSNTRSLARNIANELNEELKSMGLCVEDLNILSINYPKELQAAAEKMAGQSFVQDTGKYAAIAMADSLGKDGGGMAGMGLQMAMGAQMAQQIMGSPSQQGNQPVQQYNQPVQQGNQPVQQYNQPVQQANQQEQPQTAQNASFCTKCRKMVSSKFCPDCGSQTV